MSMKTTVLALILMLVLLLSAVAGIEITLLCNAEDVPQDLPTIDVLLPTENQGYASSDVWLNFTVNKPET